jgi:bifunctional enzyme CysN/CysC
MAHQSTLIAEDIEGYLTEHEQKSLLRLITCGSVDDGKSTLLGRLLYESKLVFEDHLAALKADSAKVGTQGGDLDFALLVDGLAAEREQGITIDVAYRFFSTEHRKFIVADTPGHEQYTRNMVTGASTADLAVLLVDARQGVLVQTRRHAYLVSLLGLKHVVLAVNKLDLVDYSRDRFDEIDREFRDFANKLRGLDDIVSIPLSALKGDNIVERSNNTPWYEGPTLMEHLEVVEVEAEQVESPFRMPVQWVNRPDLDFRGFSGTIVSGSVKPGDSLRVVPAGRTSTVKSIVTYDGELEQAGAEQAVTLTLADEIDVSRGDVLVAKDDAPQLADQFEAEVVWMADEPLHTGAHYLLKVGTQTVGARVAKPKHRVDVNTLNELAAKTLDLNEIGRCVVTTDRPITFEPYADNRDLGGFILIDRQSNLTVAAGMIDFALRRAQNVHWEAHDVDKAARGRLNGHRPAVIWLTGLSGAGKSSIADVVEKQLHHAGVRTYLLDGDNIRHGLSHDLGFTEADRIENIRRVGEVAKLMVDAGLVVITAFISPFREERQMVRDMVGDGEFIEVFVDTPLETAEERDPKGLYRKARSGKLKNFTGVDSPYEPPEGPEVHIKTAETEPDEAARQIIAKLTELEIVEHVA